MAVNLNVVSQFDSKGIDRARAELDKLSESTKSTSQKLMQGAAVAGAGILAGAGAIGMGLYQIGTQFDDAFDRIRIGTGATGPALEALQNDMKAVAGSVPTSFADAGTAITEFNRRLGLTGDPLQQMSKQVLELSRITNTDLQGNLASVAQVMQNFGVSAGDQSGKLDLLFRASQKSGLSVQDLAGQMSGAGVVLRELGLGFDQSAALLATLGKAGVDVGDVMPAMSKSLAVAAKQGKDASTVFSDTFAAIKNAPSDVAASGVALEVFGAKAGPKLAAMIREGKLSFEEMSAALANGDSILKAGQDTQDFGEKLTTLKNRVFLAIEPIATKVFNAIGDAMDKIGPKIEDVTKWLTEHTDVLKIVAGVVGGVVLVVLAAYTASMVSAAAATVAATWPILAIVAAIAALVAAVVYAWNNWDWFRNAVTAAWEAISTAAVWAWNSVIKPVFAAIVSWVQNSLIPFLGALWDKAKTVWAAIANVVTWAWNNVIQPAWTALSWYITNILVPYYTLLWNVAKTVFEAIANVVMWAWNNVIQPAWTALSWFIANILVPYYTMLWNVAKTVFEAIANVVMWAWNNVIQPAWTALSWFITNILVPYFQLLWNIASTVFNAVASVISWAWNSVISPAFDAIKGGIGLLIGVFGSIKDAVSSAFSGLWNLIVDPVKGAINWIIDKWNALEFKTPSVDTPFGTIGGFTIGTPDIPRFKSGGIFNTPMSGGAGLAVLHDNEMILNAQQQKALFGGQGVGGGQTIINIDVTVPAAADKAAVGQSVVEAIAAYERRSGKGWRA